MRKLRTKKQAWKYKSSSTWVNAVYEHNKKFIDEKLYDPQRRGSIKQNFKDLLLEQIQRITGDTKYGDPTNPKALSPKQMRRALNEYSKVTIRKALDRMSRSDTFSSFKERQSLAAYNTIRENKEAFKEFRKATGWKQKVDISKFTWDKKERVYTYEGKKETVYIDLNVSPKAAIYTFRPKVINGKERFERYNIAEWELER